MSELLWSEVSARRLERHGLATPLSGGPAQAASAMLGAHAQVLSAAELSIGLRADGVTRTDVERALWIEHSIVKTFGPRGTAHLLATQELPLWTGALAAVPASVNQLPGAARLTSTQIDDIIGGIADALDDAELTVDELDRALDRTVGGWATERVMPAFQDMWPRWRQFTSLAAHRGALVFGEDRDRRVTYTSPKRWLPGFAPLDAETASAELLRRYLRAYGPAAPEHYAQWLNAPRVWAGTLFDSLTDELEPVTVDGVAMRMLRQDPAARHKPPGIRLLPYFDAFVVGSHPRTLLFAGAAKARAMAGGQAGNFPVLLIDGTVGGVWHLRRTGRRLQITVEPLRPLTRRQQGELNGEVERLGHILEGTPTLTIGPVTVGPHA